MDTDWVEVRTCRWLHDARLLQSVLAGAGIDSQIPDEHAFDVQPFLATASGGVRLLVPPGDRERATELLDGFAAAAGSESQEDR